MKHDFKILLGDPNQYHAVLISRQLSERYPDCRVDLYTTVESIIKGCSDSSYDVAIVDPSLNGHKRLEILDLIHQADIDLPVIVVTAHGSEQEASEAIRSGAAEYILKENSYYQVLPRVVSEVCRRRLLVKKNRELEERLRNKEQKDLVKIAASTLSHEINNPLQTIMSTAELMLDPENDAASDSRAKVKIILKSAQRIQTTLHRLTNLATPAVTETVSGAMIDPLRSRIYTRRKPAVKLAPTE